MFGIGWLCVGGVAIVLSASRAILGSNYKAFLRNVYDNTIISMPVEAIFEHNYTQVFLRIFQQNDSKCNMFEMYGGFQWVTHVWSLFYMTTGNLISKPML